MCRSVDTMEADNLLYFCRLTTTYTAPGGCKVWYCGIVVPWYRGTVVVSVQFVPASSYSDVTGKQLSN